MDLKVLKKFKKGIERMLFVKFQQNQPRFQRRRCLSEITDMEMDNGRQTSGDHNSSLQAQVN